jgi:hypothetical protein
MDEALKNNELDFVYPSGSLLITDEEVYPITLYDESLTEYNENTAYINGNYFYVYRGEKSKSSSFLKPGIYKDPSNNTYFRVDPVSDEDKETYLAINKIATLDTNEIIKVANLNDDIFTAAPESSKIFMPSLTNSDDILKRLAKQALIHKNIDLDKIKDRFTDKNALFNFKQVIKGDNKLSILIFDRGMDALNLKYTIIVEEKDPEHFIGDLLDDSIVASSEDTFDI